MPQLFMIEILMRMLATGPSEFFADGWNRMDVMLVGVSGVDLWFSWIQCVASP